MNRAVKGGAIAPAYDQSLIVTSQGNAGYRLPALSSAPNTIANPTARPARDPKMIDTSTTTSAFATCCAGPDLDCAA
jgi:hypothetical protein